MPKQRGITVVGNWTHINMTIPPPLAKMFRKKLIDDDISLREFYLSFVHAYVKGEILVEHNPILRGERPCIKKSGNADEYRLILTDPAGNVLNPIPMTDEIL